MSPSVTLQSGAEADDRIYFLLMTELIFLTMHMASTRNNYNSQAPLQLVEAR